MQYRKMSALSIGHMLTDMVQGSLPAALPFFIMEYNLSYAAAASIIFAANITSSVLQPLIGYFSDKFNQLWMMPAGAFLAGAGLAMTGLMSSYYAILLSVAVSGVGLAIFHPEGAKTANRIASAGKGTGISVFSMGGNAGFAIGPLLVTGSVLMFGMKGMLIFLLPAFLAAFLLWHEFAAGGVKAANVKKKSNSSELPPDQWRPFAFLSGVVIFRSMLFFGLNTFLPIFWITVLQETPAVANMSLTVMFTVGVLGTLLGGRMGDKFGYRRVMLTGFICMVPLLLLFVYTQSSFIAFLLLPLISLTVFCTYSPIVVSGQSYLPNRIGLASGVTLGLAVSVGGLAAPMLGWLADQQGVQSAMTWLVVLPILALFLTICLPTEKSPQACQEG